MTDRLLSPFGPMSELPLIFVSGLLGSSHCVGMCGGFALAIGLRADRMRENLRRQMIYSAGRLATYSFLGVVAGTAGQRLARSSLPLVNVQGALAILAGVLLVAQGLQSMGLLSFRRRPHSTIAPCLAGGALKTFLTSPDLASVFLAGLMTGFLPCGLVYAYLALASASASLSQGLATMAVFGAGTLPLMLATGLGSTFLSLPARRRLLAGAAWCVLLTGALSTWRGAVALAQSTSAEAPTCPFCTTPSSGAAAQPE